MAGGVDKFAYPHDRTHRQPLMTTKELADEFGVSVQTLAALLAARNGPKPELKTHSLQVRSTWYAPAKVRKWWKELWV